MTEATSTADEIHPLTEQDRRILDKAKSLCEPKRIVVHGIEIKEGVFTTTSFRIEYTYSGPASSKSTIPVRETLYIHVGTPAFSYYRSPVREELHQRNDVDLGDLETMLDEAGQTSQDDEALYVGAQEHVE